MDPRITYELARSERVPVEITRLAGRDDLDALVHRAAGGEEHAWTLLVARFDRTVRSLARRYGLSTPDSDEVAQRTWLALYRHIDRLCTHPAVAGWLTTTARHECLRILAARKREVPVEEPVDGHEPESAPLDSDLLEAERRDALHRALAAVPEHERRLMRLILEKPQLSYEEISAELGIPIGSIGPTRGRCVARLRRDEALARALDGRPPAALAHA
jgi:RNA polymerase sigma factor (sigma-70 family)